MKLSNGDECFRLRTMKLRGQFSQGLVLPVDILPSQHLQVGDDVTELMGITKYEQEPELGNEFVAPFPSLIPKTDATRIQNVDLSMLENKSFHVSEKVDGTSCTVYWDGRESGVCSRNHRLEGGNSPQTKWASFSGICDKLRALNGRQLAIQGELLGPKIQSNRYKLKEVELFVFSVWDIENQQYLEDIGPIAKELGLRTVPVVDGCRLLTNEENVDSLLNFAEGKSALNLKIDREGLVWVQGTNRDRLSIKTISNAFLAKQK